MDDDKVYPDDLVNEVHEDGTIYTGAIFDIFGELLAQQGIDIADCPGSDQCDELRDQIPVTCLVEQLPERQRDAAGRRGRRSRPPTTPTGETTPS